MRAGLCALRNERGFAIPTVLTVMVVGMGFSAVAVTVAITSQGETTRDLNRKSALAIADAGAQRALFTYNKITTTMATPCVVKDNSGPTPLLRPDVIPAATNPFCGPVGGVGDPDTKVGSGYYTYWVAPCVGDLQAGVCNWGTGRRKIKIVSEGVQNGISRRVAITASGIPGSLATRNAKAIGLDGITMSGWTEMEVPAATNKSFAFVDQDGCPGASGTFPNNTACPRICPGDWKYPVEVSVGPPPNDLKLLPDTERCTPGRVNPPDVPANDPDYPTANFGKSESDAVVINRTISLAPVDIGSAAATNDDGRLGSCTVDWTNRAQYDAALAWNASHPKPQWVTVPAAKYKNQPGCTTTGPTKDPVNSGPGTVTWDDATKTLTMNGTGDVGHRLTLNLGGPNYYFCKVQLTGFSQLLMARTAAIAGTTNVASKIYFDSPENCPGNPTTQISVKDGSNIASATWNANIPPPNFIGLLPLIAMVGSSDVATKAEFVTGTWYYSNKAMLYAPRTDIVLDTWARENEGWFAGKTIAMRKGAEIESPPTLDPVGVGIAPTDFILFHQDNYVECGPPGTAIDANC